MSNRTVWIIAAVVAVAAVVEAIFVPHKRGGLIEGALCAPIMAWTWVDLGRYARQRRQSRKRGR